MHTHTQIYLLLFHGNSDLWRCFSVCYTYVACLVISIILYILHCLYYNTCVSGIVSSYSSTERSRFTARQSLPSWS
jgi:hypothetical protein